MELLTSGLSVVFQPTMFLLIIFAVFINQILANKRMQLENDLRDAANAARKS